MNQPTNPILKKLLKRNAKSRGKIPMSEESMNSMIRATHGRFDNVQLTQKRGRPVLICRGLATWPKHDRLQHKGRTDGSNTERSA